MRNRVSYEVSDRWTSSKEEGRRMKRRMEGDVWEREIKVKERRKRRGKERDKKEERRGIRKRRVKQRRNVRVEKDR